MQRKAVWLLLVLSICLSAVSPAVAQESRGAITGQVTDPGGAVIVGANVIITNLETGTGVKLATNESGNYVAPLLQPGFYRVEVQQTGFTRFLRNRIELRVADRLQIDVQLQLGEVSTTMVVIESTPLLEAADSSMGQVLDSRRIAELPIAHGNVYALIGLAPGASFQGNPKLNRPFEATHIVNYAMDGVRGGQSDLTLDGVSNTALTNGVGVNNTITAAYVPPTDALAEAKVQTASFDAKIGQGAAGMVNNSLKAGTNSPHGTGYYTKMTPGMVAADYFDNANRLAKPEFTYDRWGGSLAGPVVFPKLYNGHNRTFFMWAYEGIKEARPRGAVPAPTVPTMAERGGDFSELLALGSSYQIYNPFTRRSVSGGRVQSDPFSGNIIPPNLINPVATKMLNYIPAPRVAGTADHQQNFPAPSQPETIAYYAHVGRIDHNFSERNRLFVRGNVSKRSSTANDWYESAASGQLQNYMARGGAIDDVYTISPTLILNARYGYTRYVRLTSPLRGRGFDLTTLGFPAALNNAIDPAVREFPYFNIRQGSTANIMAAQNIGEDRNIDTHTLVAALTKSQGAHTLEFGHEYRAYHNNRYIQQTLQSGNYDFSGTYVRGPLDNANASPMGQGFTSLLLGLPDTLASGQPSSNIVRNPSFAEQSTAWMFYFQDNWRVSRKLNVTLGLRYELEGPMTERFNRAVRGFDANAAQPSEAAAKAAYATIYGTTPTSELPPDQFKVRGGLLFAGVNGQPRELWNRITTNFMPRVGFAYSANPKTVVRGGYGIYFSPLGVRRSDVIQNGFSRPTQLVTTNDNGLTWAATLSNPFPNGILEPMGAGNGVQTDIANPVGYLNPNPKAPYMQRWQVSIQREILPYTMLDLAYVGNIGTNLETETVTAAGAYTTTVNVNAFPNQYLSTSPIRDAANIQNNSYWTASVTNPFYGLPNMGSLTTNRTVARNTLIVPYPQFGAVTTTNNDGTSWYHSLQARLERRFNGGLTMNLAYTWSKFMEKLTYLNAGDAAPSQCLGLQDTPHRIVVSSIYELPFGRKHHFLSGVNGVVDGIIGGWQLQGIYTYQTGIPLAFPDATLFTDQGVALSDRNPSRWFNTSAFLTTTSLQPQNHLRTFPYRLSSLRADATNNWDLSIIKKWTIKERVTLNFKGEAFNAFNHARFAAPAVNPYSSTFGTITATAAYQRQIQLSLKAQF